MKKFLFTSLAFCAVFALVSCDDDDNNGDAGTVSGKYCYVLNQGNFNGNDASLQVYDMETGNVSSPECTNDIFCVANGEILGDVAQDLLWIDDKLFVTVSTSQKLEILDEDGKRLRKHVYTTENACPRNLATDGDNVYVTNHDGYVYVYDVRTGDSITRIYSGSYPEGISCCNGFLVVNNSNYGGYGGGIASISIIDTDKREVVKNVTEGVCNPYSQSVVCDDEVYIIDSGNYSDILSTIYKVNLSDGTLTKLNEASLLASYENYLYFTNASFNYSTYVYDYSPLYRMDVTTGEVSELLSSDKMENVYSLDVNPENGDLFVGYSEYGVLGVIRMYNDDGVQKGLFDVGYYTSGVRFEIQN